MTTRISTGLRSFFGAGGGYAEAFTNGRIEIYSGSQPASADAAVTGTLLCVITKGSATHTPETRATGTITLTGGSSGSITSVTVGGHETLLNAAAYNTSLTQTATDLAAEINATSLPYNVTAAASGTVVTVTAPLGSGAGANTAAISVTATGITSTTAALSGGVTALNGVHFGAAAGGVVAKRSGEVWSGINVASGTAGWFRFYGAATDTGAADATLALLREDGSVSTSGAQLNLAATTLTSGVTTTIDTWSRSFPAS